MEPKADMLKKITVIISPAGKTDVPHRQSPPFSCEFIYGIGPRGLTPFEYAMAGKTVGDEFCITIHPFDFAETFQHLPVDLPKPLNHASAVSYSVRIVSITSADNREIVSAMANLAACTGCCGH